MCFIVFVLVGDVQAVSTGHETIASMCRGIEAWAAEVGKAKRTNELLAPPPGIDDRIKVTAPCATVFLSVTCLAGTSSLSDFRECGCCCCLHCCWVRAAVNTACSQHSAVPTFTCFLAPVSFLLQALIGSDLETACRSITGKFERSQAMSSLKSTAKAALVAGEGASANGSDTFEANAVSQAFKVNTDEIDSEP